MVQPFPASVNNSGVKYQSNVAIGHVRLQADKDIQFLSMNRQAGEQAHLPLSDVVKEKQSQERE